MTERTELQGETGLRHARELSIEQARPPGEVPGYRIESYLGGGAYGEVWVATDRNTGRQVAIKFFTRGAKDWSLLSREVEKLVALSTDRYVVQLLEVGWEMFPPYYVMELMRAGSLEEALGRDGTFDVPETVALIRDLATGLMHLHGKGILHCDLKPANVLLDDDGRPRLADFGQSRLVTEQAPALGTLFYMAPEQADLRAVPDARWDVYALGAILHTMLTGRPPYRSESVLEGIESATDLSGRLVRYREGLRQEPPPRAHRQIEGVDRALAEIIERSLAFDPRERFPTPQSFLEALDQRDRNKAKRPIILLGLVLPMLLLAVMMVFTWFSQQKARRESRAAVLARAGETTRFASRFVAEGIAREMDDYVRRIGDIARDPELVEGFRQIQQDPTAVDLLDTLADPNLTADAQQARVAGWKRHPARQTLVRYIDRLGAAPGDEAIASFFTLDVRGTHLADWFSEPISRSPVGENFAWRGYFHAGTRDLDPSSRPPSGLPPGSTLISPVFQSTASNRWKMAITRPVLDDDATVLGYVALTLEMGRFLTDLGGIQTTEPHEPTEDGRSAPGQRPILLGHRSDQQTYVVLQHPRLVRLVETQGRLPDVLNAKRYQLSMGLIERLLLGSVDAYYDPLDAFDPSSLDLGVSGSPEKPSGEVPPAKAPDEPQTLDGEGEPGRQPGWVDDSRAYVAAAERVRLRRATGLVAVRSSVSSLSAQSGDRSGDVPTDRTPSEASDDDGGVFANSPTVDAELPPTEAPDALSASGLSALDRVSRADAIRSDRASVIDNADLVALVLQDRASVLEPVEGLSNQLVRDGIEAFIVMGLLIVALWFYAVRLTTARSVPTRLPRSGESSVVPAIDAGTPLSGDQRARRAIPRTSPATELHPPTSRSALAPTDDAGSGPLRRPNPESSKDMSESAPNRPGT